MLIRSSTNRTIKDIRRLLRSKGSRAVLEGPNLLREALEAQCPLETVLMTPSFLERDEGAELAARLSRPPLLAEERILAGLTDADSPQGALAIVELERHGVSELPLQREGLYLYLDGIQDPGNLGALARVAEATDCVGLALAKGTVHPNHPRALRASAGSLLRVPIATSVSVREFNHHLRSISPRWLALEPKGGKDLYEGSWEGAWVLVLGAEGRGLSQTLFSVEGKDLPVEKLTIPLANTVESLNVTVAAAVALFEIRRSRS
ncbi:MAG: RNA methyltransferase [Deltaproteobacteria bacterium]|nr:RNA methyltransferase [Deltaproteobacteria bacterium]